MPLRGVFNFRSTFAVLSFGFKDILSKILSYASVNTDYIIIGKYFGEQVLGIYGFAFSVVSIVNTTFGVIFTDIGISLFSRLQGDPKKSRELFLKMTQAIVLVMVPYAIVVLFSAPSVIEIISFIKRVTSGFHQYLILYCSPCWIAVYVGGFPTMVWVANGVEPAENTWQLVSFVTWLLQF
jgi:O-antigen/teichoic acid export membrane protein